MKKNKALQYFTDEYLKECKKLSPTQIAQYLEDFRQLHSLSEQAQKPSILISIKMPPELLGALKLKAKLNNIAYQTQIKKLIKDWVDGL